RGRSGGGRWGGGKGVTGGLTGAAVSAAIAVSGGAASGAGGVRDSSSASDTSAGGRDRKAARHLLSAMAYSQGLNGRGYSYWWRLSQTARKTSWNTSSPPGPAPPLRPIELQN